jgi:septum site-determining protein MinC
MDLIRIKGIGESIQISALESDWTRFYPSLMDTLTQQADFFQGARLALNVENIELETEDLQHLLQELVSRDINLWAIYSTSEKTLNAASELGIAQSLPTHALQPMEGPLFETEIPSEDAKFLHRTLRSGQSIHYAGHVVVLGDVNPGAEIVAGGNVIVWGRLRGTVHAGATGDKEAIVCALDLAPTQLRIGRYIATSPERRKKIRPEMVRVHDEKLLAEEWHESRRL